MTADDIHRYLDEMERREEERHRRAIRAIWWRLWWDVALMSAFTLAVIFLMAGYTVFVLRSQN